MATQIQLPPGRIVEGNVYKSSTIGMNGQVNTNHGGDLSSPRTGGVNDG